MVKRFLTILVLAILTGCDLPVAETTPSGQFVLPQGLKDCTMYTLTSRHGTVLYVMRCPESQTTTTRGGKSPSRVVVLN